MNIAATRRDLLQQLDCLICNQLESSIFFSDDYQDKTPDELLPLLEKHINAGVIPSMIITMGAQGAIYCDNQGNKGYCPAKKVNVIDTTGAGDSFCAGVVSGLTYGCTYEEAIQIGARLAASVITSTDNVCPRFKPRELGLKYPLE